MGNFFEDLFSDPAQVIIDPFGALANAAGLPVDATRVGWAPWEAGNLWNYIQSDWRAIKHMLVPDLRRDREVLTNSGITPRRIIYGMGNYSGQLAYAESTGDQNQFLHLVIILAGHPVTGFGALTLDDQPLSYYGSKVYYELFDGTQTDACATLVAASNGRWTTDHKLLGCPYLYLRLEYDESLYPNGIPVPKVVISGKKVLDPRTGLTIFTENAVLCCYDYMMMSVEQGGMGCDSGEINSTVIVSGANSCDVRVVCKADGSATEPRYECNGSIDIDGTPADILSRLLTSMGGTAIYSDGQWGIYPAAYNAPEEDLDETWLNGGISIKLGSNKNELVNTVKGTYIDPTDSWAAKGFPTITSDTYIEDDGGEELTFDLTLGFTTSVTMAQRLAKIHMERSRRGLSINYPCNLKAAKLKPNSVVTVSNQLLGWDHLEFRLVNWIFSPSGGVVLSLSFEDADVYNWTVGDVIEVPTPPITNLPDPRYVSVPGNLTATPQLHETGAAGSARMDLKMTWDASGPGTPSYQVQYKLQSAVDWSEIWGTTDTTLTIPGLAAGDYDIRVRACNSLGAVSDWATQTDVVPQILATVPNVINLQLDGQPVATAFDTPDIAITWSYDPPDPAETVHAASAHSWFKCYEIVVKDGDGVTRRTDRTQTESYVYTQLKNSQDGSGPCRNVTFSVRMLSAWEAFSATPATLTVSNANVAALTGIALSSSPGMLTVRLPAVTDPDFAGYLVYASQTQGFTPGSGTQINSGGPETTVTASGLAAGTWYVVAAGYDKFGATGLNYSAESSITVAATTAPTAPDTPTLSATDIAVTTAVRVDGVIVSSATCSWGNVTGADSYELRYKEATATDWTFVLVVATAGGTSSVVVSNLRPNVSYVFGLRALAGVSASAWCADVSKTTATDTTAPAQPGTGGLTQTVKNVIAKWGAVTDADLKHYKMQTATDSGFTQNLNTYYVNGTMGAFSISPGTTYYVRVYAIDSSGNESTVRSLGSINTVLVDAATILAADTVTADLIYVANLAAVNADMGDLTAGTITLNTTGHIKCGQAGYATNGVPDSGAGQQGFWFGRYAGEARAFIGHPSTAYIHYSPGATNPITIGGSTLFTANVAIGSGNSIFKADSNGIYLGNATFASAPFRVTPAGALTATGVTITGAINATSGAFSGSITSSATITGGTIQTASAGTRVVLDGANHKIVLYGTGSTVTIDGAYGSGYILNIGSPSVSTSGISVGVGNGYAANLGNNGATTTILAVNSGSGMAGDFQSTNSSQTLYVYNNSAGAALKVESTSGKGINVVGGAASTISGGLSLTGAGAFTVAGASTFNNTVTMNSWLQVNSSIDATGLVTGSGFRAGTSTGYTGTVSVRKGDDSGTLSLTITGGIITGVA